MAENWYGWTATKPRVEQFCEGQHLQADDWMTPFEQKYPYISDYEWEYTFCDSPPFGLSYRDFNIKSLLHATPPSAAADIIRDSGLRPSLKKLKADSGEGLHLIWWGIKLEEEDIDKYMTGIYRFTSEILLPDENEETIDSRMESFCNSQPFATTSRFGNIVFEYSVEELLREYSSQFCDGQAPELRIMGTFAYKQEVMHAFLICRRGEVFNAFDFPPARCPIKDDTCTFPWSPLSTGDRIGFNDDKGYRRWEHATFAFLVPKDQIFRLENLDMHMSYCEPAVEAVFRKHTFKRDKKRWRIDETLRYLHKKDVIQPDHLLRIIQKHLEKILGPPRAVDTEQSEDDADHRNCACTYFVKIQPRFLQTLLGGDVTNQPEDYYCPHVLFEMTKDRSSCTQQWQEWIHKITHPDFAQE